MIKRLLIILGILFTTFAYSQSVEIKPILNNADISLEATYLIESMTSIDEKTTVNFSYRFIVTTSEIYDQIYIERVSYGEDGGSKMIDWKKKIDMEVFYNLGAKGEITDVRFIEWTSKHSLKFEIQNNEFELIGLNTENWVLKKLND